MIGTRSFTAAATALLFAATPARAQAIRAPAPCTAPEYRAFDFWLGEWDVTPSATASAPLVGTSRIEQIAGGCGLLENWSSAQGVTGKSLNAYNPQRKKWEQFWVGGGGAVTEYRESELIDHGIRFATEDAGAGQPLLRLTFTRLGNDLVRQLGERSVDGGHTWATTYDFYYHRHQRGSP